MQTLVASTTVSSRSSLHDKQEGCDKSSGLFSSHFHFLFVVNPKPRACVDNLLEVWSSLFQRRRRASDVLEETSYPVISQQSSPCNPIEGIASSSKQVPLIVLMFYLSGSSNLGINRFEICYCCSWAGKRDVSLSFSSGGTSRSFKRHESKARIKSQSLNFREIIDLGITQCVYTRYYFQLLPTSSRLHDRQHIRRACNTPLDIQGSGGEEERVFLLLRADST